MNLVEPIKPIRNIARIEHENRRHLKNIKRKIKPDIDEETLKEIADEGEKFKKNLNLEAEELEKLEQAALKLKKKWTKKK